MGAKKNRLQTGVRMSYYVTVLVFSQDRHHSASIGELLLLYPDVLFYRGKKSEKIWTGLFKGRLKHLPRIKS